MRMLLMIAVAVLGVSVSAFAERDGNEMGHNCHLAVAYDNGNTLSNTETADALACLSYVAGFLDATHLLGDLDTFKLFCFSGDRVPVMQGVKIFIKYLDAHPEELHKSAEFLLARSLQEAFPCKASPK